MANPLRASAPEHNATVNASAGTGKTWLLVTRLIRLLLAGARADGILAVTFTRKAATEMQTRLNARLLELAQSEPARLKALLQQIDAPTDAVTLKRATTLYEDLLRSPFTVKTTTFHAFCQDILRRFPLEAGIPPGFELLESTAELKRAAWDALCADASRHPQSKNAQAIETLFESCNGLANTQTALNRFLDHRSDWWAFTESQTDPLGFAMQTLSTQLNVSATDKPETDFFNAAMLTLFTEFVGLLQKHPGKKNAAALDALTIARDENEKPDIRFAQCCKAFLTASGTPLARKESKAQAKSMGDTGQQRFLELHQQICEQIAHTLNIRNAMDTLCRTSAWYQAGSALLAQYQQLKAEQRLLDFADLEWQAYRLLNHSDNVQWIQYKLDQRIDHLLIDEFQDTNPTQWRLILPLLEELAANENRHSRSVFLVGDNKQSIYRFRRADPELFVTAQDWLDTQLDAITQPLDTSWRSAEAIMTLVNRVFGEGPLHQQLMQFSTHATHHPQLWGQVEFLPLIAIADDETGNTDNVSGDTCAPLRNPLQTPRLLKQDQRHLEEGRLVAKKIRHLIDNNTLTGPANAARSLNYGDIIILLRHRTHASDYEKALREADIPYIGANRGTLLQSLEAQDLVRLLSLLVTPFNNLGLASVLRSPLFDCSHEDLIALASHTDGQWIDRLTAIIALGSKSNALQRAHTLLSRWREQVDTLPVHDLLDRIYCEGDVLNRYHSAYPAHLQHRVAANLTRFIELALEIDSGRYPSIGRFVSRLHTLQQQEQDAPDEGSPLQAGSRVRLMTIHAAKGLEAPVVFLVDSTNVRNNSVAHQAIVDWPAQAPRPASFLLAGTKEQQDTFTQNILDQHAKAETREDANLLYVAITRPKQFLFISGCQPRRGSALGWYGFLQAPFVETAEEPSTTGWTFTSGQPATHTAETTTVSEAVTVPQNKIQPLVLEKSKSNIAPSNVSANLATPLTSHMADPDACTRGIAIHRMLQLLSEQATDIPQRVATELDLPTDDDLLTTWFNSANTVFHSATFNHLFDPAQFIRAHNEVPLHYTNEGQSVYGIIDRLVISKKCIWLVDYKTHHIDNAAKLDALAKHYQPQLNYYRIGIQRLWPTLPIEAGLLFTDMLAWKPLPPSAI
ncbi:MAG: UvrD-helicase domain-containing protein [Gammaproteobacteria bacterium]|nr:UvrD-helicase domain-containing protein [Gammaproteobacteria bacterium]